MTNTIPVSCNWSTPQTPRSPVQDFTSQQLDCICAYHQSIPGYAPTPLVSLPALAKQLGVSELHVKDESGRFGLQAFKGLGAAWAMARYLAEHLGIETTSLRFETLKQAIQRQRLKPLTFTTTTDGNHGRAVAWMARLLDQKAVITMPAGSSLLRLEAIRREGASAEIVPMNYDDAVRLTAKRANDEGWIVLQDTAWPGYETIPLWIMQGYSTLIREVMGQMTESMPTHILVPAGVGAFAGALQATLTAGWGDDAPRVIVVESQAADCLYRSAIQVNGNAIAVDGALDTIMAGLACGEANTLAWPILRDHSAAFLSCADEIAALGMRILAAPLPGDTPITSGESGAVTMGALWWLCRSADLREQATRLGLTSAARVVVISTEGNTDPQRYQDIVWGGAYPVTSFASLTEPSK